LFVGSKYSTGRDRSEAMNPAAKKARVGESSKLEKVKDVLMRPMQDYAETHGLVYADKDLTGDPSRATQCPVAMLPFKLPAQPFHHAVGLSPLWNKLVDKVARDTPWLYSTLDAVLAVDPFTRKLVEVCKEVEKEGLRQKTYLGIHRSDYMLHEPEGESVSPVFLQVELNTIASSMGSHASNAAGLHAFLLGRYVAGVDDTAKALQDHFGLGAKLDAFSEHLPANPSLIHIPAALAKAHAVYGGKPGAVVLFVVQGTERNFADQRFLEFSLWERHKVPVVRKTLAQIAADGAMDSATGRLCLGGVEVSVVYYRAGYEPEDYPSDSEWGARLMMEKSLAIKCPSIAYHIVGAKKVQQALERPGAVERYLTAAESQELRTCFAGLWGLGPGEDDAAIIKKVMEDPRLYVMKPQREGGGHNFYGQDVAVKLKELSVEERGAFILMQRICPRPQAAILTRNGVPTIGECVSEFGFYSVFVGDEKTVHMSEHAGHLVRSKLEGVDEGGVAAGYAVISSPFLVK